MRRNLAEQGGVHRLGDVADRETESSGVGGTHPEVNRRTGLRQAVKGVHHAGHRLDLLSHARRRFLQPFQVGREQFDFDRVGRQLQVTDDIGQDAGKIPADRGKPFVEFVAEPGDDFLRGMFAVGFELDRKVASIRLGNEHAQLRAEPAGITLHILICAEDGFRLVKHP